MKGLETKTEVILEYDKWDFHDRIEKAKKNAVGGEITIIDNYDTTPLKDGRTMYYVMVRYQVLKKEIKEGDE